MPTAPIGQMRPGVPATTGPKFLHFQIIASEPSVTADELRGSVEEAFAETLKTARAIPPAWDAICRAALRGNAFAAHTFQTELLRICTETVWGLRTIAKAAQEIGYAPEQVKECEFAAEGIERRFSPIFGRWKTPEDLEYLAAETLVPSEAHLEALSKNLPYPQAWYDQDGKPW